MMTAPRENFPTRHLLACIIAVFELSACRPVRLDVPPAPEADAIFTAAYHTFAAEALTGTALLPPTGTPPPTLTAAVIPSATTVDGGLGACDAASYVADVTIPDGETIAAGSSFTKTWLLQNSGTCTWTTAYSLSFHAGDLMGGTAAFVAAPVPAGGQSQLSVNLIAPASSGTYTGQWQMVNAQRQPFGSVVTVVISVGAAAECRTSSKVQVTIAGHINLDRVTIDYGDGTTLTDSNGMVRHGDAQQGQGQSLDV